MERIPASEADFQKYLDPIYHVREWHSLALIQVFPPAIRGKKFNQIIDDELRPLRNEVAHGPLALPEKVEDQDSGNLT